MSFWQRIREALRSRQAPDDDWSDSFPVPDDLECPDTQPTSPGALDSDMGALT